MSKPELFFNKEDHTYYIKKSETYTRIPSVTTVISVGKYMPNAPEAMKRGTLVHELTESIDKNNGEIPPVTDDISSMLDEYKKFITGPLKPTYHHIEAPVLGAINGLYYAGTVDRIGTITISGKDVPCIIDIKTGTKSKDYALQLAAYANAYYDNTNVFGALVYLKKQLFVQVYRPSELAEALKLFAGKLMFYYGKGQE